MQLWQRFCTAAGTEASNDGIRVICAGMFTFGVGAWSFSGNSQSTRSAKHKSCGSWPMIRRWNLSLERWAG